jgi:hypothetical protein
MAKSRSIQDIPGVLRKKTRSNCQILLEKFLISFGGVDTGENCIMREVALKRLPELLGLLDFFVSNCKRILP